MILMGHKLQLRDGALVHQGVTLYDRCMAGAGCLLGVY